MEEQKEVFGRQIEEGNQSLLFTRTTFLCHLGSFTTTSFCSYLHYVIEFLFIIFFLLVG